MQFLPPRIFRRIPLLVMGIGALVFAMWGGLVRMGWAWWLPGYGSIIYHGPLMIGGFLGTLLSLERAVALGRKWPWPFIGPITSGIGAVCLLVGTPLKWGQALFFISSIVLVIVFIVIVLKQKTTFTITMGLGAVSWAIGNVLWMSGWSISAAVPWWIGFLVLTIVGERLELSRFLKYVKGKQTSFVFAVSIYSLGIILTLFLPGLGWAVSGLGMLALAIWLSIYDIAWRTIRQRNMTGFVAVCLLCGYFWLAVGGVLAIYHIALAPAIYSGGWQWIYTAPAVGLIYDQIIHAVLLGFVMSMIFGHVLIIFPSVLGVLMKYSASRYWHVALLQFSVALRICCDIMSLPNGRKWAGLLNAIAILLFLFQTITSVRFRKSNYPPSKRKDKPALATNEPERKTVRIASSSF